MIMWLWWRCLSLMVVMSFLSTQVDEIRLVAKEKQANQLYKPKLLKNDDCYDDTWESNHKK